MSKKVKMLMAFQCGVSCDDHETWQKRQHKLVSLSSVLPCPNCPYAQRSVAYHLSPKIRSKLPLLVYGQLFMIQYEENGREYLAWVQAGHTINSPKITHILLAHVRRIERHKF